MSKPIKQNRLVFRTPPGAVRIPAGTSLRLPFGGGSIHIANFSTIRVYCNSRPSGNRPVSVYIHVLDKENDELIFLLDHFTLLPGGSFTQTYDVPGRALVVFAIVDSGESYAAIDFGVLGFGLPVCSQKED